MNHTEGGNYFHEYAENTYLHLREESDKPIATPEQAMGWPLRLIVVFLIACALGAAYFH